MKVLDPCWSEHKILLKCETISWKRREESRLLGNSCSDYPNGALPSIVGITLVPTTFSPVENVLKNFSANIHDTSMFGTLSGNRKKVPKSPMMVVRESVFYSNGAKNLVKYQARRGKTVVLLSTLHKGHRARLQMARKSQRRLARYTCAGRCLQRLDAWDGHSLCFSTPLTWQA